MIRTISVFIFLLMLSSQVVAKPPVFVDSIERGSSLSETLKQDILVIFGAEWCGACVKLKREIYADNDILDNLIVYYVDYDKNKSLAKKYNIRSLPTSVIIQNGKEIGRRVGYSDKKQYSDWLK